MFISMFFVKPANLPDELKGGKSFALLKLKVTSEEATFPERVVAFVIC